MSQQSRKEAIFRSEATNSYEAHIQTLKSILQSELSAMSIWVDIDGYIDKLLKLEKGEIVIAVSNEYRDRLQDVISKFVLNVSITQEDGRLICKKE